MKRIAQTCIVLLACHAAVSASEQSSIDVGRGAVPMYIPSEYNADTSSPLVVLLHGYTSTGKNQNSYMKFSNLVDTYGFLFLAPDGTREDSKRKSQFWNATEACCNFHNSSVDDSTYLRTLIEQVKSDYNVDSKRIFLIGHSNGGFMSYRMAYDHPDLIAAIVSLAGASMPTLDREAPATPVSILQIHGTEDGTISYEGSDIGNKEYPGAEGSVKLWAAYNGCASEAKPIEKTLDLDRRIEGKETHVTRYTNDCNRGGAVELWTIEGGSHIPAISDTFSSEVIEWLFAHPKDGMIVETD
ncbi:MAG: hypothetical protein COA73_08305 [Candidatus Hydrogenedentota bacterium]|nr:MAG: hypothetical protein COA73_08305 [Candidatus Hydrogenedentota bacterium]